MISVVRNLYKHTSFTAGHWRYILMKSTLCVLLLYMCIWIRCRAPNASRMHAALCVRCMLDRGSAVPPPCMSIHSYTCMFLLRATRLASCLFNSTSAHRVKIFVALRPTRQSDHVKISICTWCTERWVVGSDECSFTTSSRLVVSLHERSLHCMIEATTSWLRLRLAPERGFLYIAGHSGLRDFGSCSRRLYCSAGCHLLLFLPLQLLSSVLGLLVVILRSSGLDVSGFMNAEGRAGHAAGR